MHDGREVMGVSFFGRVAEAYHRAPKTEEHAVRLTDLQPNAAEQSDHAQLDALIKQQKITIETLWYLYSMIANIAFELLKHSLINGEIRSSEEGIKGVALALTPVFMQKQRMHMMAQGTYPQEVRRIHDSSFDLMEDDKAFVQRLLDGAYNDATLRMLQPQGNQGLSAVAKTQQTN